MRFDGHTLYPSNLIVSLIQLINSIKKAFSITLSKSNIFAFKSTRVDLILIERSVHIVFHLKVSFSQIFILFPMQAELPTIVRPILVLQELVRSI